MTNIGMVALGPAAPVPAFGAPAPASPTDPTAARDAQIGGLAETSAGVNQLQGLASTASALSGATLPAAALPSEQQQRQAQEAAVQPSLKLDFYADAADGGG